MAREITCYVHDQTNVRYVTEYLVTIGTKQGYTSPTIGDIDEMEKGIAMKLHKTAHSLARCANSSPFDLDIEIDKRGSVRRDDMEASLQEQAEEYDSASVRHLR